MSSWMRRLAVLLLSIPLGRASLDAQARPAGKRDWRDGGTCYEIFVRSFYDSDGDGVGDLKGLIQKLDYINDGDPATTGDLGVNCLWLMPIMPSPSYHGYDVTDYYHVNPSYGSNQDFKDLVAEAHRRGVKILVDMVPNHTSDQHPWFLDAVLYPQTSPYRSWYRWSDHQGPPNEWGGYNWHRTANGDFYYGFFAPTMPDLNWNTPAVRAEFNKISDFWLKEMGADGFREDAVRHLMEDSTHWANAPATHDVLREYEAHIRQVAPDAFTIGEVFDSTDILKSYYPDQLDAYFAFQVANAILGAVTGEGSAHLLSSVMDLQGIAPDDRWAPFLRNHDQSRTMTWLKGDMARAKLAASLLFTLPGVPFVYYGEEIGMTGDKPDPRIRTPMHWDLARAAGFTAGMPWEPLQPDSFTANVQVMDRDPASLLNHYRRLIHLRASNEALGSGDLVPLDGGTDQVAAYLRKSVSQVALVVANLGDTDLAGVALSSAGAVLPQGRYRSTALLGGGRPPPLNVRRDGRIRGYVAIPSLAPLQAYVIGLSSR